MNPGDLRHRIIFQRLVETTNEVGETVQTLEDYATVWAAIEPTTGREYYEAQKLQPELTYKITVRYLEGITPDMTIKFKDRTFRITSIINPKELNERLEIMCTEQVSRR